MSVVKLANLGFNQSGYLGNSNEIISETNMVQKQYYQEHRIEVLLATHSCLALPMV